MNRIKELREKHGMSQTAIAKIACVHQTAVSQWENGRTSPDIDSALSLCKYFNVSLDYFFGRTNIANFDEIKKAPFVSDERINLFFQLDEEDKDEVYGFMKMKLDKPKYKQDSTETA